MTNNKHNPEVSSKSSKPTYYDLGVCFETGRHWARFGDEYRTFFSAEIRDQWIASKRAEGK